MENNSFNYTEKNEEEMQLIPMVRYCYHIFLKNWKWFALSLIFFLALGFLYQQHKSRIYMRQAVMLIEDAETDGYSSMARKGRNNMSSLLELNGISVGDNLKNEIFILTSYRLMNRVVDSLHLNVDYTMDENLHEVALYKNNPFEVKFQETEAKRAQAFDVKILDYNTFMISDLYTFDKEGEKIEYKDTWTLKSGVATKTPIGEITIYPKKGIDEFPIDNEIHVTHMPKPAAAAVYHGKLSASEYDKESSLIVLSCNDMNPRRAEDVLIEVFEAYKRDVVENKNRVAQSTMSFIDERINLIGTELSTIENNLADFKQINNIIDFKQSAQVFTTESSNARQFTIEAETRLEVAKYLKEFLSNHSHATDVIPMLNLEGATFTQQIAEYNKLMLERNSLIANTSEKSNIIIERDRQLSSLRNSILASVNSYVATIQLQVKEARQNENKLTSKVSNVPTKEKEALSIERQQMLKSTLYNYLLNKREEVAMKLAINEANVRLVEYPMGNPTPVSPRRSIILAISFILGLIVPSAFIWIRSLFDVTVSGRKDIEDNTSIPLAGEIPHWENNNSDNPNNLISKVESDAPIVESLRVLRHGLNFMNHEAKVFVTTSTTPGQGKSFISCNLSIIYSMTGKRVLLIDADIRKRTLSQHCKSIGLSGYLIDKEDNHSLESLIVTDGISKGVDLLPAGMLPPNPSELLMSDRLEKLVETAKQTYDYIVLDTTPMFSVADASIVARIADVVLYVVRVGVQEREFLPELEKMYQNKRLPNMCIVLNDSKATNTHNSYGYGYGYGYDNKKKNKND